MNEDQKLLVEWYLAARQLNEMTAAAGESTQSVMLRHSQTRFTKACDAVWARGEQLEREEQSNAGTAV